MPKPAFKPLTKANWRDLVALFGRNGASSGCWCMFWVLGSAEYRAGKGALNRERQKRRVAKGPPPGLIAYVDGKPAGWVRVTPRKDLQGLARARLFKPVDGKPVWSIPCLFVHRDFRGIGLSGRLIAAAVKYAKSKGAKIVESYPWKTPSPRAPQSIYTGIASVFEREGFKTVAARAPNRPMMRKALQGGRNEPAHRKH